MALQGVLLYPLKQGLKLISSKLNIPSHKVFTLLSIKTRIETKFHEQIHQQLLLVFTLLSIKTRIETLSLVTRK